MPGQATSNFTRPVDWMTRDGRISALRASPAEWSYPEFSPNGRKLALVIDDGQAARHGRRRSSRLVTGHAHRVSARVMFARFAVDGGSFQAEQPQPWAPTGIRSTGAVSLYDLHPDGQRLVVLSLPDRNVVQDKVVFVFNFFDHLRTIAPVTKP